MKFRERIKNAWNIFANKDPTIKDYRDLSYYTRPDRFLFAKGNERSIITSVLNRISLDASSVAIKHVKMDENNRFIGTIEGGLNDCLNYSANLDQTGRGLLQDIVMSLLDEGCVAVIPTHTTINPKNSGEYSIDELRTGKITEWKKNQIKVKLYNEETGKFEELYVDKRFAAIIESPLYSVINQPNSVFQRLKHKLNLLDLNDNAASSGKIDMIIQLPYTIKTDQRKAQAEQRRKDIEDQLVNSKYGIAYTDATEKIVQLNRSLENNLMSQIEYLTSMLYGQLGITEGILNGTASPQEYTNYLNRTIEPILSSITLEFDRKFITKTARTQGQRLMFFIDPFRLLPVTDLAELADKFTRNAIMSSNEFRQLLGLTPSDDPYADQLVNNNLYPDEQQMAYQENEGIENPEESEYESESDDILNQPVSSL